METKVCRQCGQEKEISKFKASWETVAIGYTRNVCKACYADRERARLKIDMLNAFGRKCECCGETHPEFLSLEHKIPGNGQAATGLQSHQLYRIARKEGWPKDKYTCLCMNCNYAKGHVGYCPHEMSLSVDNWYQKYEHFASHPERDYILNEAQKAGLAVGPLTKIDYARARWERQKKMMIEDPNYYRSLSKNQKTVLRRRRAKYDA